MRLFFAVMLPKEIQELVAKQLVEKVPAVGYNRTKTENLHITLLFLGEIEENRLEEVKSKLKELETIPAFEAELSGIGQFLERTLWLKVNGGKEELEVIVKKLFDSFEFSLPKVICHVTLARKKPFVKDSLKELAADLDELPFSAKFRVEKVDLVESVLLSGGPKYRVVFSQKLGV
ncbi:MAG: RNA 2',3'-cyclic phosphodiesterase [Candidatus Micrarchaeota archaeon]